MDFRLIYCFRYILVNNNVNSNGKYSLIEVANVHIQYMYGNSYFNAEQRKWNAFITIRSVIIDHSTSVLWLEYLKGVYCIVL